MSVLCLGVSAQCPECIRGLRRSHDEAIPNPLAKFELGHTWILPFLLVPSIAKKTSMSVDVWMVLLWGCLDNVKMVSEGVWGGFNAKSVHDTQILPFFQCQEFLSLEPSTECCCENPRKLWYDDHDWKSQMFGVMAQHVFHDDKEDRTAWGVVYELTQCFYMTSK